MDIDFDHSGVGGDHKFFQPVVRRRVVAFQNHFEPGLFGHRFNQANQGQVRLQDHKGGQEQKEFPFPDLQGQGGGHRFLPGGFLGLPEVVARMFFERRGGLKQGAARLQPFLFFLSDRQTVQGQPQPRRGIAGDQVKLFAPKPPSGTLEGLVFLVPPQGQHKGHLFAQVSGQQLGQLLPFQRVFEVNRLGVQVGGNLAFLPQEISQILKSGDPIPVGDSQPFGQLLCKPFSLAALVTVVFGFQAQSVIIVPNRQPVLAPITSLFPPRQRLTGVPLALAKLQDRPRGKLILEAQQEVVGPLPFVGAVGGGVPFRRFVVVHGNEGWFTADGQADIFGGQYLVHLEAQVVDLLPIFQGIGLGDPGVFMDADHFVFKKKLYLTKVRGPGDRRCTLGVGGSRKGDVSFTGKKPTGRVQPHPSCTRDVHLAPSMEVGKVFRRAAGAVQGLFVRLELDQITGNKPSRQPQVPKGGNQQPSRIPAGAGAFGQGLLTGLYPRFQADGVGQVVVNPLVQINQKVHRNLPLVFFQLQAFDPVQQQRPLVHQLPVRGEVLGQPVFINKGEVRRLFVQKEVKGIDHLQVRNHFDLHLQALGFFRKNQPGQIVAEGVLLPVDEVLFRENLEAKGQDRRAAVGRRSQAHHMGTEVNRPIIAVFGVVDQFDTDGHSHSPWRSPSVMTLAP